MLFLRHIICVTKEKEKLYAFTIDGAKYLLDDITEDGLIYDGINWQLRFTCKEDLGIIKAWKAKEELDEIIYILKSSAT